MRLIPPAHSMPVASSEGVYGPPHFAILRHPQKNMIMFPDRQAGKSFGPPLVAQRGYGPDTWEMRWGKMTPSKNSAKCAVSTEPR